MKRRELHGRQAEICLLVIFLILFLSSNVYSFPYKDFDIAIQGSIGEMYDDNLTYVKYDKKGDFITTLGFVLDARYEGKRRALQFTGTINQLFNTKFKDIKNSSENLTFNFNNEFSKYDRVSLTDTFSHTQSPATFEEEFGRIRSRYNSYSNNIALNYSKDISEQFTLVTRYTNSLNRISGEGAQTSYRDNRLSFEVDYTHSIATIFFLSYDFFKNNFNIFTHTFTAGMKRYITRRLYLDGRAGVDVTTFSDNNKSTQQRFDVSITDEIDENTTTRLSFIRRGQATSEVGDVFRNWQITGGISRDLLKRLSGSLSGFYGQGRFVSTDITDTLLGATFSLNYVFNERLQGNLQYSYSNLDSTDETRGYTKSTMFLGLTVTF